MVDLGKEVAFGGGVRKILREIKVDAEEAFMEGRLDGALDVALNVRDILGVFNHCEI